MELLERVDGTILISILASLLSLLMLNPVQNGNMGFSPVL